jgi:hypothetical protein
MQKVKDLTTQVFGKLTVLSRADDYISPGGKRYTAWHCRCDCGNQAVVCGNELRKKSTVSCGCYQRETVNQRRTMSFGLVANTSISKIKSKFIPKNNQSGVRGVYWDKQTNKWGATIGFQGKRYRLGFFPDLSDAIKARKLGEGKYFEPIIEKYEAENNH